LSTYPSATVASFSFLTPVFSLLIGAVLFSEALHASLIVASLLVGSGIMLINRRG
jgi:drug/metabolite transporter (DMT)-like permease